MARTLVPVDSRRLVHPLSYVREEMGWTYQDVVDIVNRRRTREGGRVAKGTRQTAWQWEHKGRTPNFETQLLLADELGISRARVQEATWPAWLPTGPVIYADAPWTPQGALRQLGDAAGAAVTDRREFLLLSAGAVTSLAGEWLLVGPSGPVHNIARGSRIGESLVGQLEADVVSVRRTDAVLGGGRARKIADAHLELVIDLLQHGTYTEAIGLRLYGVAAEFARIAGWACFDAGYHAAAERYWASGLRAAQCAGDRAQGANILKCMSLQRVDTDNPKAALDLAVAAYHATDAAPPRVRAMLACRVARSHAALGDAPACIKAIGEAEKFMAKAPGEPAPGWAAYFDTAEFSAQVAACFLLLEDHAQAGLMLDQTLALQPADRRRDRDTYLIWQATVAQNLNDLDRACDQVSQAMPGIVHGTSARNRARLDTIYGQLTQHDTEPVRALAAQYRELQAV